MVDLSKYNKKEVCAAIRVVKEILECEDFGLIVAQNEDNEPCFKLVDNTGANWGNIEDDEFYCLGDVINRTENYHKGFYDDLKEQLENGAELSSDYWQRKILIVLESRYVAGLLLDVDVETCEKYKDVKDNEIGFNGGEQERYIEDGNFDAVGYLCDKSIALEIINTESAYKYCEIGGKFYLSEYGAPFENNEEFKQEILHDVEFNSGEGFYFVYDTYAEVIDSEFGQILEDMQEMGLFHKNDWDFYLTEHELEYIGFGQEIKKLKDKELNNSVENILGDAVNKAEEHNTAIGSAKSAKENEKV